MFRLLVLKVLTGGQQQGHLLVHGGVDTSRSDSKGSRPSEIVITRARRSPVNGLALFTYQAETALETLPAFRFFFRSSWDTPDGKVSSILGGKQEAALRWLAESRAT
jgi:hypothetical protein